MARKAPKQPVFRVIRDPLASGLFCWRIVDEQGNSPETSEHKGMQLPIYYRSEAAALGAAARLNKR